MGWEFLELSPPGERSQDSGNCVEYLGHRQDVNIVLLKSGEELHSQPLSFALGKCNFMRRRVFIWPGISGLLILLFAFLLSKPGPEVIGTLTNQDRAEIIRIVRREMRQEILRMLSQSSVREIPPIIKQHWRDRIMTLEAKAEGTVTVTTGGDRGFWGAYGSIYVLKRASGGWSVTSRGRWQARRGEIGYG